MQRSIFFAWQAAIRPPSLAVMRSHLMRATHETGVAPGKEPEMQMSMRLNVLAMVFSFGFLAAIVFGML